jgi:hypothetical protein
MPIQQVWLTSKGTQCTTKEAAIEREHCETLSDRVDLISEGHKQSSGLLLGNLIVFLQRNPKAKDFVEAVNFFYNQNKG